MSFDPALLEPEEGFDPSLLEPEESLPIPEQDTTPPEYTDEQRNQILSGPALGAGITDFALATSPPGTKFYNQVPLSLSQQDAQMNKEIYQGTLRNIAQQAIQETSPESLDIFPRKEGQPPSNAAKIASGIIKGGVGLTEGMLDDPENIPLLLAGGLSKTAGTLVAGGFMADMAAHSPELYAEVKDALQSGDLEREAEALTKAISSVAFFGAMGAHVKGGVKTFLDRTSPEARARIYEQLKPKEENAIQERSTEALPVGETPGGGKEVGQGIPKPKAPTETQTPVQPAEAKSGEAPLNPEEQGLVDQAVTANKERGTPVDLDISHAADDVNVASYDSGTGKVSVNVPNLRDALSKIPEKSRADYMDSLFNEEGVHKIYVDALGADLPAYAWEGLSGTEKKLFQRSYYGKNKGAELGPEQWGHEYLRRLQQWSLKVTPTEIARAKGRLPEWITQHGIDAALKGIDKARKVLNTEQSKTIGWMLDQSAHNLEFAKAQLKLGSQVEKVSEENPKDLIDKVGRMSPTEFADWSKAAKGGFTTEAYRLGDAVDSQSMADHLKAESDRLNAEGMAALRERTMESINRGSALVSQAQFFKEAWQRATGVGSGGEMAIKEGRAPKWSAQPEGVKLGSRREEEKSIARTMLEGASEMKGDLGKVLRPPSVSIEAETTAGTMREKLAELARKDVIAQKQFGKAQKAFEKMGPDASLDFIAKMEKGQPQATPELQAFADTMRKAFNDRVREVRALGTGKLEQVVKDYFPHIWKNPEAARSFYDKAFGKRPLRGSSTFLKKRTIPTIEDGIEAGLELESWNPVDSTLARLHEMDRYVMGQKVINEMKRQGLLQFSTSLDMPEGHARLNDPLGTVIQFRDTPSGGKERIVRGYYTAPADAARIINNYLSPGLQNFAWYKALRGTGNTMNQVQLGLSFFHGMFTALDSATSKTALGIEQITRGKVVRGIGNVIKGTVGNIITNPLENFLKGNKVLQEYTKPGSVGGEYAAIVDQLVKSGGRAQMEKFYKNSSVEGFWRALGEGNYGRALLRAPLAAIEYAAKPLMEGMVPRMKLGIFSDLARHEMERLGPNATPEQLRKTLGKAWDSVENRMGQMAYDNLFWNKTLKDLLMVSVRSVGWNFGTLRELGGGVLDTAKIKSRLADGDPAVTHRMAYLVALPMTIGLAGAVYQYLKTGKGPEDTLDYFAPKTGRKNPDGTDERIQLPSYIKDIMSLARHPIKGIGHKLHPLIGTVADMLANKDFYGTKIRNPDDPLIKQMLDEAKFVGSQFKPFSIQSGTKRVREKGEVAPVVESFFGLVPAAKELSRSKAMNRMVEMYLDKKPEGGITQEQRERYEIRRELAGQYRSGDKAAIQEAQTTGKISGSEKRKLLREVKKDGSLMMFKRLTPEEAMVVYDLGTPKEKQKWKTEMRGKLTRGAMRSPEKAQEYRAYRGNLGTNAPVSTPRFDPALLVPE